MSSVGSKGVIIQDYLGGDAVTVTNSRLDVNAQITIASDDINIGNVVLQNDAGTDIYSAAADTDASPNLDTGILLGTHSLLSARVNGSTTLGLTCLDSTHNALHVAISDGIGVANVNASSQLEVEVKNSSLDVSVTSGTTIATYPQFDVGTSPIQLSSADGIDTLTTSAKEIIIQCDFDNTGYVMVGDIALVADTDGIRLEAGDTLTLAATHTANIYLRGSAVDQLVNVMIIS